VQFTACLDDSVIDDEKLFWGKQRRAACRRTVTSAIALRAFCCSAQKLRTLRSRLEIEDLRLKCKSPALYRGQMVLVADALETLSAGVLIVSEGGTIEYANAGATRVLRLPREALLGRNITDVLLPMETLLGSINGPEARREVALELADGTVSSLGFTVSGPNSNLGWTVLFQEIGGVLELRRERDRLLQMAALGDALPSILHELRNPLAAVTSALEVMVEDAPVEFRDDLHAILWEVRRMKLTLQGVGGLVRPVHAEQDVAVDMAIEEAVRILTPMAATKQISLRAEVPTLPLLPLDWGVVSGVVFNLVKNAIEACSSDGEIVVRAGLSSDVAANGATNSTFTLQVTDSGIGMSPETLAQCRQLFFTSKAQGSGIGLALCQQIAESSGGKLEIQSAVGVGTTVMLVVPLRSKDRPSLRRRSGAKKSVPPKNVI